MEIEKTAVEQVKDESVVTETSQPSTHEDTARQGGWKPVEEWDGNPDDWITAKEFNQRGEFLERIKTQSSHIKKLEKKQTTLETTINELADHHRKVAETERKKALDELKGLKKQALDIADHDRVVEIDDRIDDLKREKLEEPTKAQTKTTTHPVVTDWVEENKWYETDKALRGAMDALVEDIIEQDPSMRGQVAEVLELAEKQLRNEFPNKFNKNRSTVTESSQGNSSKRNDPKYSARNLTEQERRVAQRFIDSGAIKNMEEYAKQLAEISHL